MTNLIPHLNLAYYQIYLITLKLSWSGSEYHLLLWKDSNLILAMHLTNMKLAGNVCRTLTFCQVSLVVLWESQLHPYAIPSSNSNLERSGSRIEALRLTGWHWWAINPNYHRSSNTHLALKQHQFSNMYHLLQPNLSKLPFHFQFHQSQSLLQSSELHNPIITQQNHPD